MLSESFVACLRSRWKWLYLVYRHQIGLWLIYLTIIYKTVSFSLNSNYYLYCKFVKDYSYFQLAFLMWVVCMQIWTVSHYFNDYANWSHLIEKKIKDIHTFQFMRSKKKWRTQEELFDCCSHIKFIVGISTGSKRSHLITNLRRPLKG